MLVDVWPGRTIAGQVMLNAETLPRQPLRVRLQRLAAADQVPITVGAVDSRDRGEVLGDPEAVQRECAGFTAVRPIPRSEQLLGRMRRVPKRAVLDG